jgi:hypothetical protein
MNYYYFFYHTEEQAEKYCFITFNIIKHNDNSIYFQRVKQQLSYFPKNAGLSGNQT